MTTRILLVALAIAWLVALAGLVWMMTLAQLRPHHALLLLINLDPVMTACVALSVLSAAIGIISLRAGARPRPLIGGRRRLRLGRSGRPLWCGGRTERADLHQPPDPLRHLRPALRRGPDRPADRPDRRSRRSRPAQPSKARLGPRTASPATRSVHAVLHAAYAPLSPGCSPAHRRFSAS